MVRMINAIFGTEMWVAEERVEEYKAAGHKLAADHAKKPAKVEEVTEEAVTEEKPKKAKATKKRGA